MDAFVQRCLEPDPSAPSHRHKASGVASKESILKCRLYPLLGSRKLDSIGDKDVQQLKAALGTKKNKTVNNALTVLSTL